MPDCRTTVIRTVSQSRRGLLVASSRKRTLGVIAAIFVCRKMAALEGRPSPARKIAFRNSIELGTNCCGGFLVKASKLPRHVIWVQDSRRCSSVQFGTALQLDPRETKGGFWAVPRFSEYFRVCGHVSRDRKADSLFSADTDT